MIGRRVNLVVSYEGKAMLFDNGKRRSGEREGNIVFGDFVSNKEPY